MPKSVARLLVISLAFAWVWLAPTFARAALVPICDAAPAATMLVALEPACQLPAMPDDFVNDTGFAPICDPRGASAIAPQRLLPVSDARLDAGPGCALGEETPVTSITSSHRQPMGNSTAFTLVDIGLPPAPLQVPRAWMLTTLDRFEELGEPRAGIARGVFHPPR